MVASPVLAVLLAALLAHPGDAVERDRPASEGYSTRRISKLGRIDAPGLAVEVVGGVALEPDMGEVVNQDRDLWVCAELLELLGAPPRAQHDDLSVLDVGEVHEGKMRLLVIVGGEVAESRGLQDGHDLCRLRGGVNQFSVSVSGSAHQGWDDVPLQLSLGLGSRSGSRVAAVQRDGYGAQEETSGEVRLSPRHSPDKRRRVLAERSQRN